MDEYFSCGAKEGVAEAKPLESNLRYHEQETRPKYVTKERGGWKFEAFTSAPIISTPKVLRSN
jgi:hypothetical protein